MKDNKTWDIVQDNKTWDVVSIKDPTIKLQTKPNTIVIKNNKVTSTNSIQKGDKLKVMTEKLPEKIASGMSVDARIIFVEN